MPQAEGTLRVRYAGNDPSWMFVPDKNHVAGTSRFAVFLPREDAGDASGDGGDASGDGGDASGDGGDASGDGGDAGAVYRMTDGAVALKGLPDSATDAARRAAVHCTKVRVQTDSTAPPLNVLAITIPAPAQ